MTTVAVSTELYALVQQLYARQMQALDGQDFAAYASTFTADGLFRHSPDLPAAKGPEEIHRTLVDFHRSRFGDEPVQRRHWFNHVHLDPQDDGRVRSTCYALVITTRPGTGIVFGPSCVVHDVLVVDGGEIRLASRNVEHDAEIAAARAG